jgi:hypothetical protein
MLFIISWRGQRLACWWPVWRCWLGLLAMMIIADVGCNVALVGVGGDGSVEVVVGGDGVQKLEQGAWLEN